MKLSGKFKPVLMMIAAMAVLSSCVSKKKYEEALTRAAAEKSALESSLASSQEENAKLEGQIGELENNLNMKADEIVSLSQQVKASNDQIKELEDAIADVFSTYDADDIKVEERDGKLYITMANNILFQSGRDVLTEDSEEVIAKLAEVFNRNQGLRVLVEGHTDSEPVRIHRKKYKDNWSLSVARSLNVVRTLVENGVDENRMTASGKGDTMPVADNETEEGRQANRRTEFIVVPKIEGLYRMYDEGMESSSSN
ncbi:MAG: OmpA family protein [Bacteroidota bacterium]